MAAGTADDLESIAWTFLCSTYAGREYWDSPLERRIDAYLRNLQREDILNDGAAYGDLIEHVMANIARARRDGKLSRNP
jgi:hypothetical protein